MIEIKLFYFMKGARHTLSTPAPYLLYFTTPRDWYVLYLGMYSTDGLMALRACRVIGTYGILVRMRKKV